MSEEQQFGHEAVEASQGFTPMPDTTPSESNTDIKGDTASLREAASELNAGRERPNGEAPPDEILYRDQHGKPTDKRQTITKERGAADLTAYREAQAKAAEREAEQAVRDQVDGLRQGVVVNQNASQPQYTPAQTEAQQRSQQRLPAEFDSRLQPG